MQQEGQKVYLDIQEQLITGFSSPIDTVTFPLHQERDAIDSERDRLEAMATADDDELTNAERASLPAQLERVRQKSEIVRELSKLAAFAAMINDGNS